MPARIVVESGAAVTPLIHSNLMNVSGTIGAKHHNWEHNKLDIVRPELGNGLGHLLTAGMVL